jgi:DNA-binding NarL/FixJ family response regulator
MNIYLVEDDTIYAEFIRKMLGQNTNYTISLFTSAEDAQTRIDQAMPDVLIVDYKLPGMSGIELYGKIKSKIPEDAKVIMMSAIDDGNMVLSFIQKGVRDYVIKDENVIDSLRAILDGQEDDYYLFN